MHSSLLRIYAVFSVLLLGTASILAADDGSSIQPQVAAPVIPANTVTLTTFGAKGDGQTMNTAAFEEALASLDAEGGGELLVPPGIWLTGPIKMHSHVNLHLERGAVIQFSRDYTLYPLTVIDMKGEKEVDSLSPISGVSLDSVAITGDGIIDGGGDAWRPVKHDKLSEPDWRALVKSGGVLNPKGDTWWPNREAMAGEKLAQSLRAKGSLNLADYEPAHQFLRPKMLRLIGCKKVLLEGVTFENPPNWTMNPALCEDVAIVNVSVRNLPAAQNSDALDLESCRHAIIRGCTFDTGDDGICIKSGKDEAGRRISVPTEDVLVTDCVVYHAHGGFTIGSEMSGGVRNLRVDNCVFIDTDVGLRFKSARGRGGVVEKIFISNIRMMGINSAAISFNFYYENKAPADEIGGGGGMTNLPAVTEATPQFRDIHMKNIVCRGAQKAIELQGLPEMPLNNITLKDVSITSGAGVFAKDVTGIRFENVQVLNKFGPPVTQVRVKDSTLDLMK